MNDVIGGLLAGAVYLVGCGLVFVLGSSYYSLFWTNRSWLFKLGLVAAAIPTAWLLLRSDLDPAYGLLAFAFLAAATANVLGAAAGTWLHRPLKLTTDRLKGIALAKGLEALAVVAAILLLMLASRIPFGDVYLQAGDLGLGLGIGAGGFVLFAVLAAGQARQMKIPVAMFRRLAPWILLFVFANAFMEELWFRALFLRPLVSLLGPAAAVGLTAIVFALAHIGATYMSKEERVRFLLILFPLGLAWGACTYFTGSLVASTIFHAGADLMIVNGFIAALHVKGAEGDEAVEAN
jgi:membrane protease YdiL (CAAX protease family)